MVKSVVLASVCLMLLSAVASNSATIQEFTPFANDPGSLDQFQQGAFSGVSGIGIDTDRQYNNGSDLATATTAVPEPGGVLACSTGLISLLALRKRQSFNKRRLSHRYSFS